MGFHPLRSGAGHRGRPGPGSAAGSIVAYLLHITNIDPLKYQLLFERFLNPERISMPDIDIDFCYERRGEVIDYVIGKYGADRVTQIITFGTMAARAVIRDVGRALAIPLRRGSGRQDDPHGAEHDHRQGPGGQRRAAHPHRGRYGRWRT